ncbi:unnamed protein product [Adineta steineri]|uniref:Uncharacterized protein n=1 Tax=Adineta steineri TaxID=433720 RepID=A0A819R1M3_9BILA|nr:unnamed protein product [Adineta steineri]CAF4037493.1 unnamed protein product [Adineta steineri]
MSSNQIRTRDMNVGVNKWNRAAVVAARNTDIEVAVGNPRNTTVRVHVNKNYPSRYNHAVNQCNRFRKNGQVSKRNMRGGDLFLRTKLAIFLILVAIIFAGLSVHWKYFIPIPLTISIVYMILSILNLHIGRTNGTLFTPEMISVSKGALTLINEFYKIPVHGHIQNQFLLGLVQNNSALIAQLRSEYHTSIEVELMLYTPTYYNYTKYIAKASGYFFLFLIIFVVALFCAVTTLHFPSDPS